MSKSLLLLILCFIITVQAEEVRHFENQIHKMTTSDGFSMQSLQFSYNNHRRDLFFPYKESALKNQDWGLKTNYLTGQLNSEKFNSVSLSAEYAKKYSANFYTQFALGAQSYTYKNIKNSALLPKLKVQSIKDKKIFLQSNLEKKYLFSQGYSPGPLDASLTAWSLELAVTYYLKPKIRLLLKPKHSWISDSNTSAYTDLALLYGFSTWPSWIWVGVGSEYLTYSKNSNFWTPSVFKSYGLRFELNRSLYKKLSLSLGANLNKIKEENFKEGDGHYINMGLMYGERNDSNFKLHLTNIKTSQSSSSWQSSEINFNWNYFF